jgi:hypothetical protein
MIPLGDCCAQSRWTGIAQSSSSLAVIRTLHSQSYTRDRNRLRNGTLKPDPQDWPLFVYANYAADPENLYDGLLRSDVLIKVRI